MRLRSRVVASAVAAVFGLLLAAGPVSAECNPDNAIFEDDFEFMDVSWGEPDDSFLVEDGALVINIWREQVNFATTNQGADVCVDMTIAEATSIPNSPVGLIFWFQDWDNFYSVVYWADGGLEVRRMNKGNFTTIFSTETLALKKGVGATNNIQLRLKPRDATIFINGTEVKRFKGVQPKDGGVIGVMGISTEDEPAKFTFDNLIVSEPAE